VYGIKNRLKTDSELELKTDSELELKTDSELKTNRSEYGSNFSLVERKTLRRAKNCLKHVIEIEGVNQLGILGEDAQKLGEGLENLLQGQVSS
jgi:hypothetical protein